MQCHGLQCGFCTPGMLMTGARPARPQPRPDRRRDPRGDLGPDLPVHRLRHDRPLGPVGAPPSRRAPGPPSQRGTGRMTAIVGAPGHRVRGQRPAPGRARPDAAQGGPALHPRPGPVRRRRAAARHAAPGHPALAAGPRPDPFASTCPPPQAHPKVKVVVTGAMLAERGLAWMPTLAGDVQAVLATDKVRFQGQEVAFVVAEDRYSARDALELIEVDYELLPAGRRRAHRARPGRAGDPRRPSRASTTTTASTGRPATRAATDGRLRPRRRGGQPGHGLSAGASGAAGDLRRGRRLRPGRRRAHALVDERRRRTPTARCTPSWPDCPSTRSG